MRAGFCVHYVGGFESQTVCPAGHRVYAMARPLTAEETTWAAINYPDSDRSNIAIFRRIPCVAENGVVCPSYQEPTAEALAQYDEMIGKEVSRLLEQIGVARPAIIAHVTLNGKLDDYVVGTIPCPVCGSGTLYYSYAGDVNKHVHAQCFTADCVQWIE